MFFHFPHFSAHAVNKPIDWQSPPNTFCGLSKHTCKKIQHGGKSLPCKLDSRRTQPLVVLLALMFIF